MGASPGGYLVPEGSPRDGNPGDMQFWVAKPSEV